MPAATDKGKMIVLVSSDGERFELPETVARLSHTVLDKMNKDDYANNTITLPNVTSDFLA
ncbi:hypothetical protein E2562_000136 [Oryza meyeriana var. granulata]|uniref:SKP1 component POZ domain-containing protein n=1 Tax=Oryza meyeriana var. granulata TaxID=110450 RepID=A0A6G1DBI6_9ORYZ|nr:hypothetical protein E2562_000136 [Oryza meyeriana var. granulata]